MCVCTLLKANPMVRRVRAYALKGKENFTGIIRKERELLSCGATIIFLNKRSPQLYYYKANKFIAFNSSKAVPKTPEPYSRSTKQSKSGRQKTKHSQPHSNFYYIVELTHLLRPPKAEQLIDPILMNPQSTWSAGLSLLRSPPDKSPALPFPEAPVWTTATSFSATFPT